MNNNVVGSGGICVWNGAHKIGSNAHVGLVWKGESLHADGNECKNCIYLLCNVYSVFAFLLFAAIHI